LHSNIYLPLKPWTLRNFNFLVAIQEKINSAIMINFFESLFAKYIRVPHMQQRHSAVRYCTCNACRDAMKICWWLFNSQEHVRVLSGIT
jgi:hypothetical protein